MPLLFFTLILGGLLSVGPPSAFADECDRQAAHVKGVELVKQKRWEEAEAHYRSVVSCVTAAIRGKSFRHIGHIQDILERRDQEQLAQWHEAMGFIQFRKSLSDVLAAQGRPTEADLILTETIALAGELELSERMTVVVWDAWVRIPLLGGDKPGAAKRAKGVIADHPDSVVLVGDMNGILRQIGFDFLAEVCGHARLDGGDTSPITATLFNGFSLASSQADEAGAFCLPVRTVSSGSHVFVVLSAPGRQPVVIRARQFHGERAEIGTIILEPSPIPERGTIVGVLYEKVGGTSDGIGKLYGGFEVTFSGSGGPEQVRADENGVFVATVPPGTYRFDYPGSLSREISVQAGQTVINPVSLSTLEVD